MLTIPITITSTVYMILLTVVYFSKERISTAENRIYSNMIKLSCFGIFVDAASSFFVIFNATNLYLFRVATKFMFVYYVMWSGMLLSYTMLILDNSSLCFLSGETFFGMIRTIAKVFNNT